MPLTAQQYIDLEGAICPYCKSSNIIAGDSDITPTMIFVNVYCSNCNESWTDEYTLTGVAELKTY